MRRIYDLGPLRLDAEIGALTLGGMPVMLGARAVAVLALLVEHAHEFVSKSRLIDSVWPDVIVEETNLAVQINAIRRALARVPGGDRWIETLIKRGYRFVGPVSVAPGDVSETEASRSNLAEPLTSFVGRERDLIEIKRLLAGKRLITIVGSGGIGKTRLAMQVAAEVMGAYRDGVWFVDLATVGGATLVPAAVAQALHVQERAAHSLLAAIGQHVRALQQLLILDNCEHVLGACVELVDALRRASPKTTILATSREPIGAPGEQIYLVQPLSLPEPDASVDLMQRSEAVQLLVDRVREQLPDFQLTADRAPAIAELCIHLDGIPLALELAAARARSLSVEQINGRLVHRFHLLTAGARAARPRQRTLRATLDWSFDLLDDDERMVLRRLAVFPGSFTVDAACGVVPDAAVDEFAVIDRLSQLVARSLLIADTSASATRYRLLETMRAYAQEKLDEAGEADVVARRHAEYLCTAFASAPRDFLQLSDARLREIYLPQIHQVRAALDWSFGPRGDAAIGIRLAGASGPLWGTLGLFGEGARRIELTLTRIRPDTPESDQALLWRQLGRIVDETPARALPAFERAAELYRGINDPLGLAHTLAQLGRVLAHLGKFDAGEAALDEANSLLANIELPWLRGLYLFNRAFLENLRGDFAFARQHYEQSHELFLQAGDEYTAIAVQGNLANICWALDDVDAAEALFRRQVASIRASPMRTKRLLGWSLANLAGVLTERGNLDEALAAGREGLPLLLDDGSAWVFVDSFALRAALTGRHRDAARLAGYHDDVFARHGRKHHAIDARTSERLLSLLHERLAADELERLRAEGTQLTESEACSLALAS